MLAYLKFITPFLAGLLLVVLGAALGDATLRTLAYGALGASGIVLAVPNKTNA